MPSLMLFQVSGFGFAGATIWQYETLRDHAQKIRNGFESFKGEFGKEFGFRQHVSSIVMYM